MKGFTVEAMRGSVQYCCVSIVFKYCVCTLAVTLAGNEKRPCATLPGRTGRRTAKEPSFLPSALTNDHLLNLAYLKVEHASFLETSLQARTGRQEVREFFQLAGLLRAVSLPHLSITSPIYQKCMSSLRISLRFQVDRRR